MSDTLNNSEVLSNKFTQSGGRFPGLYKYDIVKYKNNEYAIITIEHKNKEVRFVVDNSNTADRKSVV